MQRIENYSMTMSPWKTGAERCASGAVDSWSDAGAEAIHRRLQAVVSQGLVSRLRQHVPNESDERRVLEHPIEVRIRSGGMLDRQHGYLHFSYLVYGYLSCGHDTLQMGVQGVLAGSLGKGFVERLPTLVSHE
jgi:hypothetical protein